MATCAIVVGPGAFAEGYSASDLGVLDGRDTCMGKAERVLRRYADTLGATSIDAGSWTVYGWDLKPGDQDVVIMCSAPTTTGNDFRRAILLVHGEAGETVRKATRDVIKGYWAAD